jgi:hypothetical protein
MKQGRAFVPAYNALAVTTEQQIVVAAELITEGVDFEQLNPMITAADVKSSGTSAVLAHRPPLRVRGQITAPRDNLNPSAVALTTGCTDQTLEAGLVVAAVDPPRQRSTSRYTGPSRLIAYSRPRASSPNETR